MTRARIAAGLSLAAVALSAAVFYSRSRGPSIKPEVSARLARAVASRDSIIELARHAPFRWTDVYIVPPYTSKEGAEKAMGVSWPWSWNHISIRDHFVLLVFIDAGRIVGIVEHPRNQGDFARVAGIRHYTRSDARFVVRPSGTDSSRMLLLPASRD